jgi:hypothetical protein
LSIKHKHAHMDVQNMTRIAQSHVHITFAP